MEQLTKLLSQARNSRILRVLVIGAIGFILQTTLFELLGVHLHILSLASATLVGGEIAILSNFILNNRYAFTDPGARTSPLFHRLVRFHLVVSISLAIQWFCVFSAEHLTHTLLYIHAAYLTGIIIGFVSNYIGYSAWVWKKQ